MNVRIIIYTGHREIGLQRSPLFCANIVKKDPGRAKQNSLATAGTKFTKPGAQNKVDLCSPTWAIACQFERFRSQWGLNSVQFRLIGDNLVKLGPRVTLLSQTKETWGWRHPSLSLFSHSLFRIWAGERGGKSAATICTIANTFSVLKAMKLD